MYALYRFICWIVTANSEGKIMLAKSSLIWFMHILYCISVVLLV